MKGWYKERWRHSLAAKGISTRLYAKRPKFIEPGLLEEKDYLSLSLVESNRERGDKKPFKHFVIKDENDVLWDSQDHINVPAMLESGATKQDVFFGAYDLALKEFNKLSEGVDFNKKDLESPPIFSKEEIEEVVEDAAKPMEIFPGSITPFQLEQQELLEAERKFAEENKVKPLAVQPEEEVVIIDKPAEVIQVKKVPGRYWTPEQKQFLKDNMHLGYSKLAEILGKDWRAIQQKAIRSNMGVGYKNKWSKEDEDFLRKNYATVSSRDLAKRFGKSRETIVAKATSMGLSSDKYWSKEEEDFIKKNYNKMTAIEISRHLDRPLRGVYSKVQTLDAQKGLGTYNKTWTPEKDRILTRDYGTVPLDTLAKRFGLTKTPVYQRAKKLGLPIKKYIKPVMPKAKPSAVIKQRPKAKSSKYSYGEYMKNLRKRLK